MTYRLDNDNAYYLSLEHLPLLQWSQLEENESGVGDYEDVAEEEARRISISLGCSASSSGQGAGGREEEWQPSLETPTTQPPAPTGTVTLVLTRHNFKRVFCL